MAKEKKKTNADHRKKENVDQSSGQIYSYNRLFVSLNIILNRWDKRTKKQTDAHFTLAFDKPISNPTKHKM